MTTRPDMPITRHMRWIIIAAAIAGLIGVYAMTREAGKTPPPPTGAGAAAGALDKSLATGAMRKLHIAKRRRDVSGLTFADADGKPVTLAGYKGKVVLLNFWATWCFPCREEMPHLAALKKAFKGRDFALVFASVDRKGYAHAQAGLEKLAGGGHTLVMDNGSKALNALGERGIPVTVLIDKQGREAARVIGIANWASDEAKRVIEALLAEQAPGDNAKTTEGAG